MWKFTPEGMIIPIKVIPKASRSAIVGWENNELKVRVAAPPEKGSANEELIAFLAKTWSLSKSSISLVSGATSRHKRLCIKGINANSINFLKNLPK